MVAHLDEDTVILLAQGALAGAALQQAEQHLSQCDACRSLLAESVQGAELADPDLTHGLPSAEGVDVPPVGAVLAEKYRVESVIGTGGMGVVLAATHLVLGNRVAIKVLRRHGPSETARFLREARIAAQVRNRHIARVFDFGQLPSGAPFLVMEFLAGRDLAQLLEAGPLPVSLAVDYVLQACEAIAQVHALGIVHRDLKPANLFLAEDQGQSLVKVLDFGIFKSIGGALDIASTALTGQHALIGSPVYMSPEQLRGDAVDARSDVWALGVILYELITGELPFSARTLSSLAIAVASEQPVPPSRLASELPRALEQVILTCLRKRPEERYPDAGALRAALLALPRKRSPAWLALAAFTLLLAGGAWSFVAMQPERPTHVAPAVKAMLVPSEPLMQAPEPAPALPARAMPTEDAGGPRSKKRAPKRIAAKKLGPTDTPD